MSNTHAKRYQAYFQSFLRYLSKSCRRHRTRKLLLLPQIRQIGSPIRDRKHLRSLQDILHPIKCEKLLSVEANTNFVISKRVQSYRRLLLFNEKDFTVGSIF